MKSYLNIPLLRDYNQEKSYLMTEDKADVWLWVIAFCGCGIFVWGGDYFLQAFGAK